MAVIRMCDVCDTQFSTDTWEGLTAAIPGEMLGIVEDGEYDICSWACLRDLALAQVDDEPKTQTYYEDDEVPDQIVKRQPDDAGINIEWGNNPLQTRQNPTDDIFPDAPGVEFKIDHQDVNRHVSLRRKP